MLWRVSCPEARLPKIVKGVRLFFNPITAGAGPLWPRQQKTVCSFHAIRARPTKILDFVSIYALIVLLKLFWEFVLKIFEKLKKLFLTFLASKGPPFGEKNQKCPQKIFFHKKSYFFFLNLYCKCCQLPFEVYNIQIFKFFKF